VMVQPLLEAVCGGVLFGADPVTGDARRLVVECIRGAPGDLVSGEATADRYVLGLSGRVRSRSPDALALDRRTRRALARLARQMRSLFGSAQDIEWALDRQGRLWLLQSRPITTSGDTADACGPILGPGPVAETFPDPLRPLERDVFAEPLRRGIVAALRTIGATPPKALARSSIVAFVGNRVAVDLELLGWARGPRHLPSMLNPIPSVRRLVAAWHVGRLRTSLPLDAARIVASIDRRLSSVPAFRELSDEDLLVVIEAATEHLTVVHAHQILAGMLLPQDDGRPSSTSVALPALGAARRRGLDDGTIAARAPVVLALVPPRIGAPAPLPDGEPIDAPFPPPVPALAPREALRLRARWLDELVARGGTELGRRLWRAGDLDDPDDVRELTFAELASIVGGGPVPRDIAARRAVADGPPLPATFRLTPTGTVVAVRAGSPAGRAAGGGRGEGTVVHTEGRASCEGNVLVTRVLSPSLAASLPGLRGLVSETGSTLSHLAILARERGVPTVVAVEHALARFPAGTRVLVDGTTGEVRCLDDAPGVGGAR